eukprot:gnl/TRDRNA2_/TRDRNA2_164408_c1_seq1.p1 gnl/TRDRNA2_/TRDRNA2_164408_c1~~gnl/TRDRNA2_/TRDRNA2_164408_c1_seq1.p1  ORF type:complete len:939 (+),score=158.85 gnl/TRDRNA2_/TRDRNA2_164408_c1_seq1:29-2818(+)
MRDSGDIDPPRDGVGDMRKTRDRLRESRESRLRESGERIRTGRGRRRPRTVGGDNHNPDGVAAGGAPAQVRRSTTRSPHKQGAFALCTGAPAPEWTAAYSTAASAWHQGGAVSPGPCHAGFGGVSQPLGPSPLPGAAPMMGGGAGGGHLTLGMHGLVEQQMQLASEMQRQVDELRRQRDEAREHALKMREEAVHGQAQTLQALQQVLLDQMEPNANAAAPSIPPQSMGVGGGGALPFHLPAGPMVGGRVDPAALALGFGKASGSLAAARNERGERGDGGVLAMGFGPQPGSGPAVPVMGPGRVVPMQMPTNGASADADPQSTWESSMAGESKFVALSAQPFASQSLSPEKLKNGSIALGNSLAATLAGPSRFVGLDSGLSFSLAGAGVSLPAPAPSYQATPDAQLANFGADGQAGSGELAHGGIESPCPESQATRLPADAMSSNSIRSQPSTFSFDCGSSSSRASSGMPRNLQKSQPPPEKSAANAHDGGAGGEIAGPTDGVLLEGTGVQPATLKDTNTATAAMAALMMRTGTPSPAPKQAAEWRNALLKAQGMDPELRDDLRALLGGDSNDNDGAEAAAELGSDPAVVAEVEDTVADSGGGTGAWGAIGHVAKQAKAALAAAVPGPVRRRLDSKEQRAAPPRPPTAPEEDAGRPATRTTATLTCSTWNSRPTSQEDAATFAAALSPASSAAARPPTAALSVASGEARRNSEERRPSSSSSSTPTGACPRRPGSPAFPTGPAGRPGSPAFPAAAAGAARMPLGAELRPGTAATPEPWPAAGTTASAGGNVVPLQERPPPAPSQGSGPGRRRISEERRLAMATATEKCDGIEGVAEAPSVGIPPVTPTAGSEGPDGARRTRRISEERRAASAAAGLRPRSPLPRANPAILAAAKSALANNTPDCLDRLLRSHDGADLKTKRPASAPEAGG